MENAARSPDQSRAINRIGYQVWSSVSERPAGGHIPVMTDGPRPVGPYDFLSY
jgi:hypothetical protein